MMRSSTVTCLVLIVAAAFEAAVALQPVQTRRSLLEKATAAVVASIASPDVAGAVERSSPDLTFITSPNGLQYADAKVGSGPPLTAKGTNIAIDYVMQTSGARYGSKIYSSKESGAPYRWKLGDGSTIQGLEQAIAGGEGVEPMRPGGVRRVIIPSSLAYQSLAQPNPNGLQIENCQEGRGVGPIPPKGEGSAAEYFQRFKNIYCNANRVYQPDLVMDVKLYGPRS